MINILHEFNNDQLDGLAKLYFDLARVAFVFAIFPASSVPIDPITGLFKIILGLIWGLACTYFALVLLKAKEKT